MKHLYTVLVIAITLTLILGCSKNPQSSGESSTSTIHDYVIGVSGAEGLQLDMLLIYKPDPNRFKRETANITVPYRKLIKAYKCAVWIDGQFNGIEGDFELSLSKNGHVCSVVEGRVRPGNEVSGQSSDL